MADDGKPRRRRKWLVLLLAIGAGAWFVRSRRGPDPEAWLPPLPPPAEEPAPRHAAATPDEATLAPAPSDETPKHAAVNGSGPVPEAGSESPAVEPDAAARPAARITAPNALFTDAPEKGVAALADGSAPGPEFVIKGTGGSMLFHTPSSPYFAETTAEIWFRTEEEATAAGFTKWAPRTQRD